MKNVPANGGKVEIWVISQPSFFATAAMIDSHPALVVSPQAPVTDYYLGEDVDIPNALSTDVVKATEHVYWSGAEGSKIELPMIQ